MTASAEERRARAELDALAHRYRLSAEQLDRLWSLTQIVASDPLAPTAVTAPEAIIRDHVADSLVALDLPELPDAGGQIDLGAGAGFPGLPLAIARPDQQVVLLEASSRKVGFLARSIAILGLTNVTAVHERAETWPRREPGQAGEAPGVALVTARAVAPLPVVLELAAPLVRMGGTVVLWRGRRVPSQEVEAEAACAILGLRPLRTAVVTPYAGVTDRHLHLFEKSEPTPARFPRRPGMAGKRPLGQS